MIDDCKWLLSQDVFGGHTFEKFEGYDMARCAKAARAVMAQEDFRTVLADVVVGAPEFIRTRRLAGLVEASVVTGFQALERFNKLPKRTIVAHRKHYTAIASLATKLADALDKTPSLYANFEQEDLRELADIANATADDAPLSRPTAKCADRTYVARAITSWMHRTTGSYRHAAAASLVNVLFPTYESIDAGYMQSLARALKDEG